MLNFSRWTPTLGVCFKWDSQKVLKIAHIGIFRHIGGVRWDRKITDIKILWVKVLHAKNGDFSTTRDWEINFFRQNIAMFDWLCTETYTLVAASCTHTPHIVHFCATCNNLQTYKYINIKSLPRLCSPRSGWDLQKILCHIWSPI